jgi:predicted membrane protein
MSTITQKKKLSKGTWVLIFVLIAAVIAVAVLAVVGYISLAFLTDALVSVMTFGTASWINAVLILTGTFVLGILFYYVVINYFVGNKVTNTAPIYTPQGQALSNPQQSNKETVIS